MPSEIENTSLTLKSLQQALNQSIAETHQSHQDIQYLSTAYISTLTHHGVEISLAHRGCPWKTVMRKGLSEFSRRKKLISMTVLK